MLSVIENLLILQDRDRKIQRLEAELNNIGPERTFLQEKAKAAQSGHEASKLKSKQIESDRKNLELEVEAKKKLIEKYSLQQFQTKKNEEYRALAHEIETCKQDIIKIEDQQLELMEKAEGAGQEVAAAAKVSAELVKNVDAQIKALNDREVSLKKQLDELRSDHAKLAEAVEEGARGRYDRLRRTKGGTALVGIEHGVCGGCHMKLPTAIILGVQGDQDLVSCQNCGRILYYARHMDLTAAD
ncbi:MAG TPA: C4-type zinc ribbon domain-containing protein [Verrucomicrobiae bacterium]|nr:C4-type zinc ribbon domain-containing protein [Verrucomicrobiae bacterium]